METDLTSCRREIDRIDDELLKLFEERMAVSARVAAYKQANGLPVLDPAREREKLLDVLRKCPEELGEYAVSLYSLLMDLSRSNQHRLLGTESELIGQIRAAIDRTPQLFPTSARVACQGVEGAYSQIACEKLFRVPDIRYCPAFADVFEALKSGQCQYGVVSWGLFFNSLPTA